MPICRLNRTVLPLVSAALLATMALPAQSFDDIDPTDVLPRHYSIQKFRQLSDAELNMVNLAIKRGRTILIDGYSASKSRQMIQDAARNGR